MVSPFRPHPLLFTGHLQTLATVVLPLPKIPYVATLHEVALSDGDRIILHDDCPSVWQEGDPVVILVHGLCGCYQASYMMRMASKLSQRDVRVFRMDMRGCGAGRDIARGLPHSGRSADLLEAIAFIVTLVGSSPISPIGVSMGGNITLKMLGEIGNGLLVPSFPKNQISRAAAIAPPVDLAYCCENLNRGINRLYGKYFIKNLRNRVPPLVGARDDWKAISWDPMPKTLWEFDDRVTAPLSGFDGVDDYYHRSASGPVLRDIEVPTMILAADDDPIVPVSCFDRVKLSRSVELHRVKRGGHVGFVGFRKLPTGDYRWMDAKLLDWLGLDLSIPSQ